jgi:hypothetical protein
VHNTVLAQQEQQWIALATATATDSGKYQAGNSEELPYQHVSIDFSTDFPFLPSLFGRGRQSDCNNIQPPPEGDVQLLLIVRTSFVNIYFIIALQWRNKMKYKME